MLATESLNLHVVLDDECAVETLLETLAEHARLGGETHAKHADEDEEADLEEVPVAIKVDLEEYELPSSKRVHGLLRFVSAVLSRAGKNTH